MIRRFKKLVFSNWVFCTILSVIILAGMLVEIYPMQFMEYRIYDLVAGIRSGERSSPIAVVTIDEKSIKEIGSWPWPRSTIAEIINRLSSYKPKVMGIQLFLPGREINPGLSEIKKARESLRTDSFLKRRKARYRMDSILAESEKRLNHDALLAGAVNRAKNAVLPIQFTMGTPARGAKALDMPGWLYRHSVDAKKIGANGDMGQNGTLKFLDQMNSDSIEAGSVMTTYSLISRKAGALGHTNLSIDHDGTVRRAPLLVGYLGRYFPSFAVQVCLKFLGGNTKDIQPSDGGISLMNQDIPTDQYYRILVDFSGQPSAIARYSAADILQERVDPKLLKNKIVLLGNQSWWIESIFNTTLQSEMAAVDITAAVVENILNRRHLSRPFWANVLEVLVVVYFGLFLVFVVPRVKARDGALILAIFLVTWIGFSVLLFTVFGYWLKILPPILLTVIGFTYAGLKRLSDEKKHESAELNKTLGRSFQSKGMLDMAFDKFIKCPVEDDSVRDLLYSLAQDFERKRMFNKALAVYAHLQKGGRYRDVYQRIETLKHIGESTSPGASIKESSILLNKSTTKPTLGRYEIISELGQGAMGTVYLGKDPAINREVAIKTLSYEGGDEEKIIEIKERFLREAEAAGKLSHPNIVTIFDVGEEHDMAWMAMELLKGSDLADYCQKDSLLPVSKVMQIISSVAEALDYAHSHGVVHRDIKPDNIILLEDEQVKVADFGIARVMSASQTQTGVILGTPNYMSPEQVEGARVDGRSDLFSLGVVMYEMLSGEKPFHGDNLAHLMYAIANASYTPLSKVNPKVPECCNRIVKKLLIKNPERRIKNAATVVKNIRQCLSVI